MDEYGQERLTTVDLATEPEGSDDESLNGQHGERGVHLAVVKTIFWQRTMYMWSEYVKWGGF